MTRGHDVTVKPEHQTDHRPNKKVISEALLHNVAQCHARHLVNVTLTRQKKGAWLVAHFLGHVLVG